MFGKTWVYESTFLIVNFMKPKYRSSISDETLTSELECTINIKYSYHQKKTVTYLNSILFITY